MSEYLEEAFAQGGYLSKLFPGYEVRDEQVELAHAVDRAISEGRHLMAEAPAGTGKTFGYGVPAIYHATKGEASRVLVATANIALQEQLVNRDLPTLEEALPWKFRYALLKGRSNYLCRVQMAETIDDEPTFKTKEEADQFRKIVKWAQGSRDGDKSELPFEPAGHIWSMFSASADDCVGPKCEYALTGLCAHTRAKGRAQQAQVVVCNYHLLFADLHVSQSTGGALSLLPSFDVLILDEAHKTGDVARDFFGFRVTNKMVMRLAKRLQDASAPQAGARLEGASGRYFQGLLAYKQSKEYDVRLRVPHAVPSAEILEALEEARGIFASRAHNEDDEKEELKLIRNARRAAEIHGQIEQATLLEDENRVFFIEELKGRFNQAFLSSKMVDVAGLLDEELFSKTHSSILTSATMSIDAGFDFIQDELGVNEPMYLNVDTPFDFENQAIMVVPRHDVPMPNDRKFREAMVEVLERIINEAEGRTLCLFTSYKNLHLAKDHLRKRLSYTVFCQGEMPRNRLLAEFQQDKDSVLLGTESFWAGVDVRGEALSCVVIDRLPFLTPADPVLDMISECDDNWFMEFSVPKAIIMFKQGVGRLIRSRSDRGVAVVLDRRIVDKGYGSIFIRSLPWMRIGAQIKDVSHFLCQE